MVFHMIKFCINTYIKSYRAFQFTLEHLAIDEI